MIPIRQDATACKYYAPVEYTPCEAPAAAAASGTWVYIAVLASLGIPLMTMMTIYLLCNYYSS